MSRKPHLVGTLLLFLTTFLLLTGVASALNQVRIECPVVKSPAVAGDSVAIKVYITNEENLGAFTLGFSYNTDMAEITRINSAPMISDLTEWGGVFKRTFVPASNQVLIGWYDSGNEAPLTPQADGLAFTMYMKLLPGFTAHCVNLDSVYVPPAGPFIFAPVAGGKLTPNYVDCGLQDIKLGLTDCPSANTAPVVADIPNQTIAEGATFATINLDDYVTDAESADNLIVWTYSGNSQLTVSIVDRVATITIPNVNWTGSETITFKATDPGGLFASDPATFTVTAVNDAPVVADIPNQTIAEGATFATISLDNYVSDVDNADAEMTWTYSGNSQLTVSIVSRVATITIPNANWNGSEIITFKATDPGGLFASDPATFTVTAVNDAPVVADIPNQTIAEGATFATISLDDYVSDVDNTDAEMVWTYTGNIHLTVSIVDRVATIMIPHPEYTGIESIGFKATDPGGLFASDWATFTITAVNDAPVVSDIPNQTIAEGGTFATISLDDYVSDVDNTAAEMTWSYSGNSELTVSIVNRVATISTPNPDWNGNETITFKATDPGGLFASDPATFTVTPVNDAPVVSDIPNQTVSEGGAFATISLDNYVSDVDNTDAEMIWTYSGNSELTVSIVDRVATITTPSAAWIGSETITFKATDPGGLFASDAATFEVKEGINPDFAIDAHPDTIIVMAGIPDSLVYSIDLTSIDGYNGQVALSVSALPSGVVLNFGLSSISVPNPTTLGGHTSVSTPAGNYELTITATEEPTKAGPHSTKVWLIVNPCTEPAIPVVSQDVFNVQIEAGQNLLDDSLFVRNDAVCGNLYWLASSDEPWVTPNPNQGSVEAGEVPGSMVYLEYSTATLDPGDYVAHVMFVPDKKKTPGAQVTINLTVTPKPSSADSIRVAHANVYSGGTVAVPVYFNNNEALGGMSVGLHWDSDDVTLDSVSHVGSRVDYINFKFATINATNKTLLLGMVVSELTEAYLTPGSGLWATMWFTAGSNCPVTVGIDSQYIAPGGEVLFVDSLAQMIYPQFSAGSITVECAPTFCISGTITEINHDPIEGATVELYSGYPPSGSPIATTTSGADGSYEFCPTTITSVFSVRAYKAGYYPDYAEAVFPSTDVVLMLTPISGIVTPTNEWVNLYCDLNALFEGSPVLPGSVIDTYDPQGVLCGQWVVSQAGTFGFMPVYRDDPYTPGIDEGCVPDDLITVKVNGYVATMANGALYWGTNGDRYAACFDVTPVPPTHCLILKQGWNLVSWNIDTPSDSIMILAKDVMDNVDVILSFEVGAQTYDPKLPEFSTLLYADHYHGFWFRMNAEDTLCVEGPMVAASTPIDLELNWNLVSYLPTVPFTVPTALASIFEDVVVVLGYDNGALTYDPAYPQFNNLDEMERDFGYWIKTTDAATLMYPGPVLAKATPSVRKSEFTPRTSQSNTWVNLYGYDVRLNDATLPVGTVIEAYDASGALVGESVVRNAGRFGFMPVYGAETLNGDAVGKSVGSVITLKVNGEVAEQTVTWSGNGDRIRINELTTANKNNGNLPNSFTLNQNYPNPFNPETSIDYVVGKSGHVELAVYNTLGNRIKTLVSGYQPAGSYTIKWQADTDAGSSVASGVYFYKLTAGDYTDTKKMTLLK